MNHVRTFKFKRVTDSHLLEKMMVLNRPSQPLTRSQKTHLREATSDVLSLLLSSPALARFSSKLNESYSKPTSFDSEPFEPTAHPGYPQCLRYATRLDAHSDTLDDLANEYPTYPSLSKHLHIVLNKPEFKPSPGKYEYTLSRPIMCANLYVHLLCSKVFRPFVDFIVESHRHLPVKIGMSWYTSGADHLVEYLGPEPGQLSSEDFKTWDFSVPAFLHDATLSLFIQLITILNPPNLPHFVSLAKELVHDFIHSKFFLRDLEAVLQKHKGTSTGYYLTAVFNSLSHLVLHYYLVRCFRTIAFPQLPLSTLHNHNKIVIYGDDNLRKAISPYGMPLSWLHTQFQSMGMLTYEVQPPSNSLFDHQFLRTWIVRSPNGHHYPMRDRYELLAKLCYTNANYSKLLTVPQISEYKGFLIGYVLLSPCDLVFYQTIAHMYHTLPREPPPTYPSTKTKWSLKYRPPVHFSTFPTISEVFQVYKLPVWTTTVLFTKFTLESQPTFSLPLPITLNFPAPLLVFEQFAALLALRRRELSHLSSTRKRQLKSLLQPVSPDPYYGNAGSKLIDIFRSLPTLYTTSVKVWLDIGSHPGFFVRALLSLFPHSTGVAVSLLDSTPSVIPPNSPITFVEKSVHNYKPAQKFDLVTFDAYDSSPQLLASLLSLLPRAQPKLLISKVISVHSPETAHTVASIRSHFHHSYLVKPLFSRPWNSELYLVCCQYRPFARPYNLKQTLNELASYCSQSLMWNEFFLTHKETRLPLRPFFRLPQYRLISPPFQPPDPPPDSLRYHLTWPHSTYKSSTPTFGPRVPSSESPSLQPVASPYATPRRISHSFHLPCLTKCHV
jgi:hypothetical protein